MHPSATSGGTRLLAGGAFVLTLTGALVTICWLWHRSHFGLDLTDESFDLIWAADPWRYPLSPTQFGFLYHPLYRVLGGDIPALRQANILLTFGIAWVLCATLVRQLAPLPEQAGQRAWMPWLSVSASLATAALTLFAMWIPSPSYNSLALQAVLLAALGLILADRSASFSSLLGWLLVGTGGWLAFMAKPPTAAALAVVVLAYLLGSSKLRGRLLAMSALSSILLLLVSAVAIDGSILAFIDRLRGGLEIGRTLDAGHRMSRLLRLDDFKLGELEKLLLASIVLVVFASSCLVARRPATRMAIMAGCITGMLTSVAIVSGLVAPPLEPSYFLGMLTCGAPLGAVTAALWLAHAQSKWPSVRRVAPLSLALAAMPYVYTIGTGNNYWLQSVGATVFWNLSGVVLLASVLPAPVLLQGLLPTAVAAQLTTVALLATAMEHPYRQSEALRLQSMPTTLGPHGTRLILPPQTAEYLRTAARIAGNAGFERGTPIIDLTGHSPGTVFALGAIAIGQPWMIGGYKGSGSLASMVLDRAPCEDLAAAWVLIEPEGPRKLDMSLLRRYGIDDRESYAEVGKLITPLGIRDYPGVYEQRLLKPLRPADEAVAACRKARGAQDLSR